MERNHCNTDINYKFSKHITLLISNNCLKTVQREQTMQATDTFFPIADQIKNVRNSNSI